jgi:protein gp37
MAKTKIEYVDYSANAWRGCQRVHAGCVNCYAERMAKRNPAETTSTSARATC